GDGNVREQRLPEVTLYRVAQPPSVLLEEGLVEMELVFDLLDPFRRRVLAAGEGERRVAGNERDEQVHEERDDQENQHERENAARHQRSQRVSPSRARLVGLLRTA